MTHPNLIERLIERMTVIALDEGTPVPSSEALHDGVEAISTLTAEVEECLVAIRELRLADGYAARTGDELRFDKAFHALCQFEQRLRNRATLTKGEGDKTSNTGEIEA